MKDHVSRTDKRTTFGPWSVEEEFSSEHRHVIQYEIRGDGELPPEAVEMLMRNDIGAFEKWARENNYPFTGTFR